MGAIVVKRERDEYDDYADVEKLANLFDRVPDGEEEDDDDDVEASDEEE